MTRPLKSVGQEGVAPQLPKRGRLAGLIAGVLLTIAAMAIAAAASASSQTPSHICLPLGNGWGYWADTKGLCAPTLAGVGALLNPEGDSILEPTATAASATDCPSTSRTDDREKWIRNIRHLHGGFTVPPFGPKIVTNLVRIETDHRWCFVSGLRQITKVWPEHIIACQVDDPYGTAGGWHCGHIDRFYSDDAGKCFRDPGAAHSWACVQTNKWHAWASPVWLGAGTIRNAYPCTTTVLWGSGDHDRWGDCVNRTGWRSPYYR